MAINRVAKAKVFCFLFFFFFLFYFIYLFIYLFIYFYFSFILVAPNILKRIFNQYRRKWPGKGNKLYHQKQTPENFSITKMFLKIFRNSQEYIFTKVSFLMARNFIKKETMTQVFSCEFCENLKNTFYTEYIQETTSVS